jgi:hypothetical protein
LCASEGENEPKMMDINEWLGCKQIGWPKTAKKNGIENFFQI